MLREAPGAPVLRFRVGEPVDVLDEVGLWSEAEIIEVQPERVRVHHLYWSSRYDEWLARDSERLQPRGTRAFVENGTLREGQRIDALAIDETPECWREACVMGERLDAVLVHYKGFSHEKFDEWVSRDSPRLQPFGQQTRRPRHVQDRNAAQASYAGLQARVTELEGLLAAVAEREPLPHPELRVAELERLLAAAAEREAQLVAEVQIHEAAAQVQEANVRLLRLQLEGRLARASEGLMPE